MYAYLVKLQDMLSNPAIQMSTKVNKSFASMDVAQNRALGGMQRNFKEVSKLTGVASNGVDALAAKVGKISGMKVALNVDTSQLEAASANADKLTAKLRQVSNGRTGGGMSGLLLTGGAYGMAAYGAVQAAQAAARQTIIPAMDRETTRFQLNELTANPAFVSGLENQFKAYAPEKMGELFRASQKLIGAGVNQSDLFKSVKMLNNISALSNTQVDELAFIQAKIKATGYVQGDEMDMFRERGISLNPYLAKVMKVQESQIKKFQEKGLITYDKFFKGLELYVGAASRFGNVYERKRDGTAQGRYNFLMGQFDERMLQLGLKTLPTVNSSLEALNRLFDTVSPLGDSVLKLVSAFDPLIGSIGTLAKSLGILNKEGQVGTGFINTMANALDGLAGVIEYVSKSIKWMIDTLFADTPLTRMVKQGAGMFLPADAVGKMWAVNNQAQNERFLSPLARQAQNMNVIARRLNRNARLGEFSGFGEDLGGYTPVDSGKSLGASAGLSATVEGARKQTTIVNIRSLIENNAINVATLNEGLAVTESQIIDMLLRAANSAAYVS